MSNKRLPYYVERLIDYCQKDKRRVIGLHSGTSADGVATALVEISGCKLNTQLKLLKYENYEYPVEIREKLLELFSREKSTVEKICQANFILGELFADAAIRITKKAKLELSDIDAIGTSGQYLYHVREGQNPEDVWIGEKEIPSCLDLVSSTTVAERTGITVVSNLRSRDIVVKGQGNPLVTYGDWVLFCHPTKSRAIQNIGGIANPTVIPAGASINEVFAFDTGPGNMVIDAITRYVTNGKMAYDKNGEIASKGRVNKRLLDKLMQHPYIRKRPPKTTGREVFGERFTNQILQWAKDMRIKEEDLVATVTAFTAESIAWNYNAFIKPRIKLDEVILSGGGVYNKTLVQMLREKLYPLRIITIEECIGIPILAREVVAVTIITNETLLGNPGNVPNATGAEKAVILGEITPSR